MAFKTFDRIQETSTTTGTGDFTLSGAVTGFKTFASRYSTADTLYYAIHEVDAGGAPSGAWEVGLGTYSAANTLTRTTVLASSNADAAVNFTSGDKRVFVTMPAVQAEWMRERLTAARTYYVRTDGSDSNNGLANTSGGAFLTIQKAVDTTASLDCNFKDVTIQIADGTYTGAVAMKQLLAPGAFTIQGNSGTPANVLISTTSSNAVVNQIGGLTLIIKDLKIATTTSGTGLFAGSSGIINFTNINFGACASNHKYAEQSGFINATGNYAISGGASRHEYCSRFGRIDTPARTVTITGTPAFSTAYAEANKASVLTNYSCTFSGSATGVRYAVALNGVIDTVGGGANYFPGNSAGTTATGGQYA